ncbi:MAG: DMT family transporter [Burkholderiaceae bacterium]
MALPPRWALEFVLLAAIWGAAFLFMRAGAVEFGAVPAAFLRVALAALCLLPVLVLQRHAGVLLAHWRAIALIGLLSAALPFALFAYALLSVNTGLVAILNATTPLFGALIAWAWLGERLGGARALGLALGFIGVVLLSALAPGGISFKPGGSGWAVLACLGAALCYGLGSSITKRYLSGVPPMAIATGSLISASLGLALPALWLWPTVAPSAQAWLALIAVALLCTALAFVLFFRLIEAAGPARALSVTFVIPVFTLCLGALFLGETITLAMLGSGAVILLGTALATGLLKLGA